MTTTQELVCRTALNKLLKEPYFSICTINDIAKVMNVHPSKEAHDMLQALHCVNYKDMPQELRQALPDLIRECLNLQPTFEFKTAYKETIEVHTEGGGFLRRLIGRS